MSSADDRRKEAVFQGKLPDNNVLLGNASGKADQYALSGTGVTIDDSARTVTITAGTVGANLDLGDVTPTAGSLDVFPAASGGANDKTTITALTNGGNRGLGIVNRAMGQATALGIPDPGAAAGEFVLTNSAHQLIVSANGADRTLAMAGNLDLGDHDLTINTSGATTVTLPTTGTLAATTGTPDATFTVDEGNATGTLILKNTAGGTNHSTTLQTTAAAGANVTLTLPGSSGTLALATGAETGTTSASFTVDSDSAAAKIALNSNSATGDFTMSLVPANLTANRTVSFADAAGTVMVLDNGGSQTAAGDFVLTGTVDFQGNVSASAGNPNFDLNASSGTFKTPTGVTTLYGNVTTSGNPTFSMAGSSGTFQTSTGTNTLNGNVVIAGTKTLTTGTGTVTLNGDTVVAAGKQIDVGSAAGGDATPLRLFSASASNGVLVLKCQDDANDNTTTLQSGDPGAGINPTVTLPIATCTLSGIGLAETFSGVKTFSVAPIMAIDDATNNGVTDLMTLTHTTSGAPSAGMGAGLSVIIENDTDATTEVASLDFVATNDGTKATLDTDLAVNLMLAGTVTQAVLVDSSDQSLTVGRNATDANGLNQVRIFPLTQDKGSLVIAAAANTGNTALTVTNVAQSGANTVEIPDVGAGATDQVVLEDVAATLTNKSIDGDTNTLTDVGPKASKAGVKGTRGATDAVAGNVFVLNFDMDNTAGTSTWINDLDPARSCKVLNAWIIKTDSVSGGAGDTVQVGGSAGVITDAKALNVADGTKLEFTTFDDSKTTIAHDATITVTTVKGVDHCECEVSVLCMWV